MSCSEARFRNAGSFMILSNIYSLPSMRSTKTPSSIRSNTCLKLSSVLARAAVFRVSFSAAVSATWSKKSWSACLKSVPNRSFSLLTRRDRGVSLSSRLPGSHSSGPALRRPLERLGLAFFETNIARTEQAESFTGAPVRQLNLGFLLRLGNRRSNECLQFLCSLIKRCGIPQNVQVMVSVKMSSALAGLKSRFLASINHGFAQPFAIASFPVGTIVTVGQVYEQKPGAVDLHSQPVVNEARTLMFRIIEAARLETSSFDCRLKEVFDNAVQLAVAELHSHECVPASVCAAQKRFVPRPAIKR